MKRITSWGSPLFTALLLVACGGGGSGGEAPSGDNTATALGQRRPFTSVVSFGDSLSDVGTYTPATAIPGTSPTIFLGGKFTTNSATSTIWVENIASRLGLGLTPAEVGFAGRSVRCPAAAQGRAATCTAYGQGGARITEAVGIRHEGGALTVPIRTQIANHLGSFGRFKDSDLILLWAGANDLLWQMEQDPSKNPESFVVKLFTARALAEAGVISPAQAQAMVVDAQLASMAVMRAAAVELAGYIRTEIVAKGGSHVAVLNLPDPAVTPEGTAITAQSALLGGALTALTEAFNQALSQALAGQPVKQIDIRRLISDVVAHPARHDMVNASVPACDAAKMSAITGGAVADGFSLFCNATPKAPYNGLRANANVRTWFFADGNHPTTGGYRLISDEVWRQLAAAGWLRGSDL
jgi:phospholipase/lecithinase/hemolysin